MPGTTIGTQMNLGYPGSYARNGDCVIRQYLVNPTDSAGPAFGAAVVINQNNTGGTISDAAVSMANGHTPVTTLGANFCFAGFAVREVVTLLPTSFIAAPQLPAIQTYAVGTMADVLERGNIVRVVTDPQVHGYAANEQVFLRISTNGSFPSAQVGDIETLADGAHTLALPVVMATGVVDANGVCELCVLSRNAA